MFPNLFARRAPQDLGRAGERHAARYLRRRGYRLLARNLRVPVGEADLVCRSPDQSTLVIVEVKSRRGDGTGFAPEVAVGHAKRRKLARVAPAVARHLRWTTGPVRIDVVTVTWPDRGSPTLRHYESAVGADG